MRSSAMLIPMADCRPSPWQDLANTLFLPKGD
jgi:hypothetical protein